MIRMIRILIRLLFFAVWTFIASLTAIPLRILLPDKAAFRIINRYCRIFCRVSAFIFGMKIIVHGNADDVNNFRGVIISNHMGYLDIFTHAALYNTRFVSRTEIRSWPIIGALGRMTICPIWVNRCDPQAAKASLEEMRDYLKTGESLIIYPEGTSTDGEHGILPFKTTIFEAIRGTDIPVQPLITVYRTKEGDSPTYWIVGSAPFPLHFCRLLGNRRYECHIFVMQKFHSGDMDRKQMAVELHRIMREEYNRIMNGKFPV